MENCQSFLFGRGWKRLSIGRPSQVVSLFVILWCHKAATNKFIACHDRVASNSSDRGTLTNRQTDRHRTYCIPSTADAGGKNTKHSSWHRFPKVMADQQKLDKASFKIHYMECQVRRLENVVGCESLPNSIFHMVQKWFFLTFIMHVSPP